MVDKKPLRLLQLLALLLLLPACLLLPLRAVPSTRSFTSMNQEAAGLGSANKVMITRPEPARMVEEQYAKMDIESNDYPGSGANNRHDPKTPGRA